MHVSFPIPAGTSRVYNLTGSSAALFLSLEQEPFLAIEQTGELGERLHADILFFRALMGDLREGMPRVRLLPEPGDPGASGDRAAVIHGLAGNNDSIVTSLAGLHEPVWSPEYLEQNILRLGIGQEFDRDLIAEQLHELAYKRVSIVVERGEYCMKGWLLDIFPVTAADPVRIEFFGDEVEEMKAFDLDSQRSLHRVENLVVLPASEEKAGSQLRSVFQTRQFLVDIPAGEETDIPDSPAVRLSRYGFGGEGADAGLLPVRGLGIFPDERKSMAALAVALESLRRENRVIIVSSSKGQAERVRDILRDNDVIAPIVELPAVKDYVGDILITTGGLSSGLFLPGLLILTERELFGERPSYRPLRRSRISRLLTTMDDIAPGDLVVHRDHGIGRFADIQRREDGEGDLIVLEYSGGDRLYIPLYNIDRIKKYSAEEGVAPHLDRLGGRTWQKRTERVRKAVREMAERLLRLYAEREVVKGFAFSPDTELHREFAQFFPYEETPDQLRAIEEIGRDMETERPMDRLLCGDVGYGKTEVAMRAAFKAVFDNRQVAVLVPTTILCEQHYLTFTARFSGFPVRIDYLSRFKPRAEQQRTLRAIAAGEVDIVISTHGLLRKGVAFANLGLLIVDEEHRFGVGQKERIKEIGRGIDVLSMTATPIPRTLQMALSGIRSMSLIETPPEDRLSVRSVVSAFSEDLIREAVSRELERGGQVLFVHNVVHDIEKVGRLLMRLVPEARIAVAHGQMAERQLEAVMHRFLKRELDLLLATNIIGAGLDIPTANTIVVNRADRMGLADLYQLRGRVGRSNVRAFAYFLIPGEDLLTGEARKRLEALREMSFLGAGFRLAMRDMEIRGAGNLLGSEQSGHIHAVGFDLYVEMLEKAVAELKGIEAAEEIEPSIRLHLPAFVPEEYVEDLTVRLSLYRRIANARSLDDLAGIAAELRDRFGPLPPEVAGLLRIMGLKIGARRLLITNVSEAGGRVRFVFSGGTPVGPERVLSFQKKFRGIRFHPDGFEVGVSAGSDAVTVAEEAIRELG